MKTELTLGQTEFSVKLLSQKLFFFRVVMLSALCFSWRLFFVGCVLGFFQFQSR